MTDSKAAGGLRPARRFVAYGIVLDHLSRSISRPVEKDGFGSADQLNVDDIG
ncbi:hypothetical protein [Micromonospora sp. DT233]|uniref:hypothetical protein n=1 Tax=Micromonospora sp. DT233 TaxID=3393432 RepID=UPI003CFAAA97